MCDHFINQDSFRVYWFRGCLPIFENDLKLFPNLAKFLNLMENLGGWQMLMNNKAVFDNLSLIDQNIFNFLNELVLRIGDDKLNIVGLENIIKFIFNINSISLFRLLESTGIIVQNNNCRISASSNKWRCSNSFTNWSTRLGFVGARDLYTLSTFGRYNPLINKVIGGTINKEKFLSSSVINRPKVIWLSKDYENFVNKYGSGGIVSNKELYSQIILSDEFRKLNMQEKMYWTFGENWRDKFKRTSIAKTNKYSQFNFGVKVKIPLLTEFETFESIDTDDSKDSFNHFVEHLIIFLNTLDDNSSYKLTPLIKETQNNGQVTIRTISTGIIVSKNINPWNLGEKLKFDMNSCIQKYQLDILNCEFKLIFKKWLSENDFFGSFANVEKVIDNILTDSIKEVKIDDDKVLKDIRKRINTNFQGKFTDIIMDQYGDRVNESKFTDIIMNEYEDRVNESSLIFKKLINGDDHFFMICSFVGF